MSSWAFLYVFFYFSFNNIVHFNESLSLLETIGEKMYSGGGVGVYTCIFQWHWFLFLFQKNIQYSSRVSKNTTGDLNINEVIIF